MVINLAIYESSQGKHRLLCPSSQSTLSLRIYGEIIEPFFNPLMATDVSLNAYALRKSEQAQIGSCSLLSPQWQL